MKRFALTLAVIFLSLFAADSVMAQKATYTSPGGLSIGFGGGASYQTSDIANSMGFGADFILGSPIYQRENAFLSVDWKFRFLGGQNRAYDHRINPDDTYNNIRYNFFSYDVEFGLTLNRLRERTRIIVSGFAGFGLTHGRTAIDLYDSGDNLYDFSSIDPNRDSKEVYHDLRVLSDGKFETKVSNKLALLPTAGLYLGYQFSRSFALGVEFKTNFNLTEYNSFTGIDIDNQAISGSGWDRNNYVSLGFRWQLGRGGSYGSSSSYSHAPVASTVVVSASSHPSVNIFEPAYPSTQTTLPNHTIRAEIRNISGPGNISFYQNGFPINTFTYNESSNTLVANVRLSDGENSFSIQATNQNVTTEDQVFITLNPVVANIPEPIVEFTSPSAMHHITTAEQIELVALVQNVVAKEDIQLTLNGLDIPFEYYPISGLVKTRVYRSQELSNLMIIGFNQSGSAQDQLSIEFATPGGLATPMVRFVNPPVPMEVDQNIFPLSAETVNVPGPNDVNLTINGNHIRNFSFNAFGEVKAGVLLLEGINTIDISVRNGAGEATERTFINYYPPVYHLPVYRPVYQEPVVQEPVYQEVVVQQPVYQEPVVQQPVYQEPVVRERPKDDPVANKKAPEIIILSPNSDPHRTYEQKEELRATVLNVISKDNIILKINGLSTRDFSFNLRTKEVIANFGLREGENVLSIQAQNEAGEDRENQVIIQELRPCPSPKITLLDPGQGQISTNQQNYVIKANIRNATSIQQLRLTVNGEEVSYSLDNHALISPVALVSGLNTLSLTAVNECGEDQVSARINYSPDVVEEPCSTPRVEMTVQEVQRQDASHELRGIVSHVKNKAAISLSLDGQVLNSFQFNPETGQLKAKFRLNPGSHTILVYVNNECGSDSKSELVIVKEDDDGGDGDDDDDGDDGGDGDDDDDDGVEEACGIRINPGNSDWQFCLVTPSGTFNRDNLTNSSFSYSGPASSLFFLPIAGGGNAKVNGRPYAVRSGQYYLFTGGLNVSVSTQNPGSMGQWSVCISANSSPVSGNGNNRPQSPCETEKEDPSKGKDDPSKGKNDPPKEKDNGSKGNNDRKKSNEVSPQGNEVSPTENRVRSTGNQSRSTGNQVRSTGTQGRSRNEVRPQSNEVRPQSKEVRSTGNQDSSKKSTARPKVKEESRKESNERQSNQGVRRR